MLYLKTRQGASPRIGELQNHFLHLSEIPNTEKGAFCKVAPADNRRFFLYRRFLDLLTEIQKNS